MKETLHPPNKSITTKPCKDAFFCKVEKDVIGKKTKRWLIHAFQEILWLA